MTDHRERSPELQELLVKAVDGELTDAEREEFERLALTDPSLRAELEGMRAASQSLGQLRLRDPNPDDWNPFEKGQAARAERMTGWLALLAGFLLLAGFALWALFTAPEAPLVVKLAVGAAAGGLALLFIQVLRRFAAEHRNDPYKDVIR
jgi:anti-sigma factor RsiW